MYGKALKEIRTKRGLTQEELGILVGKSKQAISRLEVEESHMSIDMAVKLARTLKVSPTIFLPSETRKTGQGGL